MADSNFEIDPNLLQEFLTESLETLDGLDAMFVRLEEKPDDLSIVDTIFRPVHSIKGNSSFFGLTNVKNFSHAMENILQEIRSHKRHATKPTIDALLAGVDHLREMMERIAQGEMSTEFTADEASLLEQFNKILDSEEASLATLVQTAKEALDSIPMDGLPEEANKGIKSAAAAIQNMLKSLAPAAAVSDTQSDSLIFRIDKHDVTKEIKVIALFIKDLPENSKEDTKCEEFMKCVKSIADIATECEADNVTESIDAITNDFTTIHESGIGFDEMLTELLRERLDTLMNSVEVCDKEKGTCTIGGEPTGNKIEEAKEKAQEEPKEEAPQKPSAEEEAKEKEKKVPAAEASGKTLRVAEEKVDSFMAFVGELIISNEVFAYIQKKLEGYPEVAKIAHEFKNANLSFNELSTNLQRSLMAVRRVPVRSALQRLPRIVRDLSNQLGKQVDFSIIGDDIQIDKSILENIENPLVHMVRNSVDHGIETPEVREAAGKPAKGTLKITAEANEETFRIIIDDDGKGIDAEAIKAKAVSKGTITEDAARAMTDREAYNLIFNAGVSTAKVVTDVSGRGVGMDVVISNIKKLNGNVDIESTVGKGTRFIITMPMTVTLLVVDGLVARVGKCSYIVPLTDVNESIRPTMDQIHTVSGKGEMINVRGELYRLLRLYDLLSMPPSTDKIEESTVILVEGKGGQCGLMVDEVIGQQSVVLKDLGKQFKELHTIKGGAIMGDGRVGLVLNTDGILMEAFNP